MSGAPPLPLEEARRRLKELGYLDGRVERFLFRRAFEGRGGLFLPAVLLTALAAALACVAAVESGEPGFGVSLRAVALLFGHLFLAFLVPAALAALLLESVADRSRAPGGAATAVGALTAAAVFTLWGAGVSSLARDLPPRALFWGIPISAAALLAGGSVRAGFLARAYAHSRVLPARPRGRRVLLLVTLAGLLGAAAALVSRDRPVPAEPPRPSPRSAAVVVVAVDGLGRETEAGAEPIAGAAAGWWTALPASPPELWSDLSTGEPSARHGVRALERVRPAGSPIAVRTPLGTAWYLKRLAPALGLASSAPVSASDRRRLAFWEVAAAAGLPTLAVGWWASGPWPGAAVVGNEELLGSARDGLEADRRARELFRARASGGERLRTLYLPGLDILRGQPERRREALAETEGFLREEAQKALSRGDTLIVLAADSHAAPEAPQRMLVFDGAAPRT
ncbi:MAG: hypothetical protein ACRD3M_01620, partial [Thermoanaerobaculia bacterium]